MAVSCSSGMRNLPRHARIATELHYDLLIVYDSRTYATMRVLIVEDDPVLADGLTRSLRQSDFAIDCIHDGEQADPILATQNYALVILDLGVPKLDGFYVLKRLRRV